MSAAEAEALLVRLRGHGVTVWAEGDRLRYRPQRGVTGAQVAALRRHKPTLLALLADDATTGWRLAALRRRYPTVAAGAPAPFLLVADFPLPPSGGCPSCGEPLGDRDAGRHQRCAACLHAITLFLVGAATGLAAS